MSEIFQNVYNSCIDTPFFGIVLSIIAYKIGFFLKEKTKLVIMNPLLIATIIIILFLELTHIPYASYKKGGDILMMFLSPVTAVLAISMYNQRKVLFENLVPLAAGAICGAVASVCSVYILGRIFLLDDVVIRSMLPKSVTTPVAFSLSLGVGGVLPLTMLSVITSGITGGILAPKLVRLFRVSHPEAAGIAIGVCSHAVGTSTALEMGEIYGAMSSVAIGCTGLATTAIFMFL